MSSDDKPLSKAYDDDSVPIILVQFTIAAFVWALIIFPEWFPSWAMTAFLYCAGVVAVFCIGALFGIWTAARGGPQS